MPGIITIITLYRTETWTISREKADTLTCQALLQNITLYRAETWTISTEKADTLTCQALLQ